MECGWLHVLENRQDPESNTIDLRVGIYKSASESPAPDPVVYLAGGPGSSAFDEVRYNFAVFQDILAERDLIVIDQRGTGYSRPGLACKELAKVFFEGISDHRFFDLQSDQRQALEGCRAALLKDGIDLSGYNNAENAADLEDLRVAMGYEQWNLLGVSYGTRLALTILREYPQGVRSAILDSTLPPEVEPYSGWVLSLDRAMRVLFDDCAADPACRRAYPNLEQDFYQLVEGLDRQPLQVSAKHPFLGSDLAVQVDGDTLIYLVFLHLYYRDRIAGLPALIEETAMGGTEKLSEGLWHYLASPYFINWGMHYSVMCAAESSFTNPEKLAKDAASANARLAQLMLRVSQDDLETCALWNQPSPGKEENRRVRAKTPTLILSGEFDPVTPPEWGRRAAEGLANSRYYLFKGLTHGTLFDDAATGTCVHAVMMSFLENPQGEPKDACVGELEPLKFKLMFLGTSLKD